MNAETQRMGVEAARAKGHGPENAARAREAKSKLEAAERLTLAFHLITDDEHSRAVYLEGDETLADLTTAHLLLHMFGVPPKDFL